MAAASECHYKPNSTPTAMPLPKKRSASPTVDHQSTKAFSTFERTVFTISLPKSFAVNSGAAYIGNVW
jgi:hypothetical protein